MNALEDLPAWLSPRLFPNLPGRAVMIQSAAEKAAEALEREERQKAAREREARKRIAKKRAKDAEERREKYRNDPAYRAKILAEKADYRARKRAERRTAERKAFWKAKA